MKVHFYYTQDKDGQKYIAFKIGSKDISPHKDLRLNEWLACNDGCRWVKVSELEDYNDKDTVYPIIREILETLPEPSWEDDVPMLVTLDIQCTNINYSYVE